MTLAITPSQISVPFTPTDDHQPRSAKSRLATLDKESAAWLRELAPDSRGRELAVARLHRVLVSVARAETRRRAIAVDIGGQEQDDLAHQAAADSLIAILGKLEDFRGESRFTTWAYRFVIFDVSTKLGRHFWRTPREALDDDDWDQLPSRFGLEPHDAAEWRELVGAIREAVDRELTPHQQQVFSAIVLQDIPLDALVAKLNTNRNAIYKTMFDARRKLRRALVANGYMGPEPRHDR